MKKQEPLNPLENIQLYIQYDIDVNGRCIFIPGDSENSLLTLSDLDTVVKGISIMSDISDEPIDFVLTSSGGEDEIGIGIYDSIKAASVTTRMYCLGRCYSMGTVVLQAADERYSFPNTRFMIHEGTIGIGGTVSYGEIQRDMREMKNLVDFMYRVYEESTKTSAKALKAKIQDKDYYFNAQEALEMGFIDEIIEKT